MSWEEQRKILIAGVILVAGFGTAHWYRAGATDEAAVQTADGAPADAAHQMAEAAPADPLPPWAPTRLAHTPAAVIPPAESMTEPAVASWNPPYAVEHVARRESEAGRGAPPISEHAEGGKSVSPSSPVYKTATR